MYGQIHFWHPYYMYLIIKNVYNSHFVFTWYRLFPFPSKKSDRERREKWLRNLNRGDELHSYKFKEPSKFHRVCSLHFIDSKPSHIHPDPEINLGHEVNKCQSHRDREQRLLKRRKVQDERQERISHCSQECDYERPSQTEYGKMAAFFSVGTQFLIFILLGDIRKLKNDLKAARRKNLQLCSEMSPTTKIITPKQYTVYIKSKTHWHYFCSIQILPSIFFVLCWKCFIDHTNINFYEQNYEINITWTFNMDLLI